MVDVLNPDSTDPLALSEDRDTSQRRDATATGATVNTTVNTTRGATIPGTELFGLMEPEPETTPVVADTNVTNVSSNSVVPRVYPNIPANIIPPTDINLGALQGDQTLIDSLLQQAQGLQLNDEFQLNQQLAHVFNSGTPFGPNRPLYQEPELSIPENPYPQLIQDSIDYRAEQAARQSTPLGIDPNTGEVVPGTRNVLSGQPLSRLVQELQQFVGGDIGNEFNSSLPSDPFGRITQGVPRFFQDTARGLRSAFSTNQGRRFVRGINPTGIGRIAPTPADRFTSNLDFLSERVIASAQLDPRLQGVATPFEPTAQFDEPTPSFLGELTEDSLVFRDIFTGLSASQGRTGEEFFAPLQGRFGDFGNAGALSGLLYAANAPEGIASGILYELTNIAIDLSGGEIPPDRVRLLDALQGRDLGFMNQASESRYLSLVDGDNHPSILSRIGITNNIAQNAIGFVTDVIWGGVSDFGVSNITSRLARRFVDPAVARALPLQTLDGTTIQQAVRNIMSDSKVPEATIMARINRQLDTTIRAGRFETLPLRATPEVDRIVRGTSRNIIINADGVPLNIAIRPIRELLQGITEPTVRTGVVGELADNLSIQRLTEVESNILEAQSAVNENLVRIDAARQNLGRLQDVQDSPLSEFSGVQIEIIRSNQTNNIALNNQIQTLLSERRVLSSNLGQLSSLVAKEINETVARGNTRIAGNVLETVAIDNNFNSVVPLIPRISVEESLPLPNILQSYRVDPQSILPTRLTLTRRTDEQLTSLAKFHNIISADNPTLTPQGIKALQLEHPKLLSRYGNPIDNNLSSPVVRLEINPPDALRNTPQRSVVPSIPRSIAVRDLPPIPRRTVNNLANRRQRLLSKLNETRDFAEQDRILNQLDNVDRRINEVISQSNPESAADLFVLSLPDRLTPLTPQSQRVARLLAQAESQYIESAIAARRVQQQLIDATEILEEQGRILDELPRVERQSLQTEVATKNNYVPNGDGIPLVVSSNLDVPASQDIVNAAARIANDDVPRSLDSHLQNNGVWYHGTKSRINNLSNADYTLGSSVTNELGPGLYLTTDPKLGEVFAKAQPTVDRVPNPSLRSKNIGEVRQVSVLPDMESLVNAGLALPSDSPIRSLFIGLVRENLGSRLSPSLAPRLVTNARNLTKKPMREWFQGLRVQWNRLRPDSQSELVQFNSLFTKALRDSGVEGTYYRHNNGHYTLALYNDTLDNPIRINELRSVDIGTGAPEEQVLNRYTADLHAFSEVGTITNRTNLESSRLNVDNRVVQNLKESAKDAYRRSLDDTERMIDFSNKLDDIVSQETKQQITDIENNGPRLANNRLRKWRGDNSAPCV